MIDVADFEGCCRAKIICDFGGGHSNQNFEDSTKQQFVMGLADVLSYLRRNGTAMVFAAPTSTQPNATAALIELGFYGHPDTSKCTKPGERSKHEIRPFFLNLKEWNKKEFLKGYDPKKDKYENGPNAGIEQRKRDRGIYYW